MRNNQEKIKCQNVVDSAMKGYLGMTERKSLLEQSLKLANQLSAKLEPNLLRSIKTIQETLYTSLLIDIHAWLFDKSNSSNLSTYQLLEKLKYQDFKKKLEEYFIEPPTTIKLDGNIDNFWHDSYKARKAQEFKIIIDDSLNTYDNFLKSEIGMRIKSIRDKLLAHKDGVYSIKDNRHEIGEAIIAVEMMRKIVLPFNDMLQKTYYPVEEIEEASIKKAELFWKHMIK